MTGSGAVVEVVAGVLQRDGRLLLARRPAGKAHAGCHEFPGGKCEPGESPEQALRREWHEELGVEVSRARPWLSVAEGRLRLHVWRITQCRGRPQAREGQGLGWWRPGELHRLPMPPLDRPVARRLALAPLYAITPSVTAMPGASFAARFARWQSVVAAGLARGIQLVSLRDRALRGRELERVAGWLRGESEQHAATVLLHGTSEQAHRLGLAGAQLSAAQLAQAEPAASTPAGWRLASIHGADGWRRAKVLSLDAVTLSPIAPTASHPGEAIGWQGLRGLGLEREDVGAPLCYALGGLGSRHLAAARAAGAHGIAGISAFFALPGKGASQ